MSIFFSYLLVGTGSFLGGCLRFFVYKIFQQSTHLGGFLYGTLTANFFGSVLLGGISFYFQREIPDRARLFFTVGLCGGFTTFSTFSFEVFTLLEKSHYLQALLYSGSSFFVSLLGILFMFYVFR